MPAPVMLQVEDLFLHYETERGPVRAVDGISLTIDEPGQVLALIGESGSGKTSLARALMRLLPPNVDRYEGRIRLNGTDLMTMGNDRFRRSVLWRDGLEPLQDFVRIQALFLAGLGKGRLAPATEIDAQILQDEGELRIFFDKFSNRSFYIQRCCHSIIPHIK